MHNLGTIYKITINGFNYFGETINWGRRKSSHIKKLISKRHTNVKLRRLSIEYGVENVIFTVIDQGIHLNDVKVRKNIEMHLIKADINSLNTRHNEHIYATYNRLPLKDKYRDKILYLEYKTGIVKIRDKRKGMLIGIEFCKGKIRSGYFVSDIYCKITTDAFIREIK